MLHQIASVLLALVGSSTLLLVLLQAQARPGAPENSRPLLAREQSRVAFVAPPDPHESTTQVTVAPVGPARREHPGRLVALDVTDPTRPVAVGEGGALSTLPGMVAVADSHVYVPDPATGLHTFDVSAPWAPAATHQHQALGSARGVAVAGQYAYMVGFGPNGVEDHPGQEGLLYVLDLVDRAQPRVVRRLPLPGKGLDIAVAHGYAYVAASDGGLRILDLDNPAEPVEVGALPMPEIALAVAVAGRHAYVTSFTRGLHVVDVTDPTRPTELASYLTPGIAVDIAVAGEHAYVADHAAGLGVYAVADPARPTFVGALASLRFATSVTVDGEYAFVADGTCGLRVVDVTAPARPHEVGHYVAPGAVAGVAVARPYVYLTTSRVSGDGSCPALQP